MKKLTLTLIIALLLNNVHGQEKKEEFKPNGKPFIRVFTNYHSTFSDGESFNAFELQRAYLGYSYNFSEKFSGKVNIDIADPGVGKLQMTAYIKNAYIQYQDNKLTAKIGMIGLYQFELQEKQWGGRYLFKSFQDEYKFGNSADLGVALSYNLAKNISVDASITNGEGYKSIETDSIFKYSAGVTLQPIKGVDVRAYYDYMGNDDAQQTVSLYAGYTEKNLKLGVEFNRQVNNKMLADKDLDGFSLFGSYNLKKSRLFARYDQLSSNTLASATNPWNYSKNGTMFIAGLEFPIVKGLLVTPNYQSWNPANGAPSINSIYLSLDIKL